MWCRCEQGWWNQVVRLLGGPVFAGGTLWQTGDMVQMTGFVGAIPCRWQTVLTMQTGMGYEGGSKRGGGGCSGYKRPWGWRELFQVACVAELGVGQLCSGCGWWWQWWQRLRVPHGFCVPKQRAEKLCGSCTAGGGIITVLMCSVGLVSMETTGLMPVDSSTSLAQSNGVGI